MAHEDGTLTGVAVVRALPEPAVLLGPTGAVLALNAAASAVLGISEAHVGSQIEDLMLARRVGGLKDAVAAAMHGTRPSSLHMRAVTPDGALKDLRLIVSPVAVDAHDAHGSDGTRGSNPARGSQRAHGVLVRVEEVAPDADPAGLRQDAET